MATKKYLFLDIEATGDGKDPNHNVIEIGAELWQDNKPVDDIWIQMRPDENVKYKTLAGGNLAHYNRAQKYIREEQQTQQSGWYQWIDWLDTHVNKYKSSDKLIALAYNARFDERHIINLFKKNNNKYIGAYFRAPFVCVNEFSLLVLNGELAAAKNRKLATIARILGIHIDEEFLHQAWYDAKVVARLYQRLAHKFKQDV